MAVCIFSAVAIEFVQYGSLRQKRLFLARIFEKVFQSEVRLHLYDFRQFGQTFGALLHEKAFKISLPI